jgi:hypothetical protein
VLTGELGELKNKEARQMLGEKEIFVLQSKQEAYSKRLKDFQKAAITQQQQQAALHLKITSLEELLD